jgi:uncharacterized cupredoxin-like copper-binding protein
MITSLLRVVAALFALTFIVAACASDTGAEWTFAPAGAVAESEGSAESTSAEEESVTQEQVGEADQPEAAEAETTEPEVAEPEAAEAETTEPEVTEPTQPAGEARVIDLQADGALRFTDATGQQIQDIPVTPGETVTFRVTNTAGFAHNFYIGEDSELMTPAGTTDTGIPDWSTGVEELEWVVPDDISSLKFGCTVPGHYTLMQGVFSVSDTPPPAAPAEPEAAEPEAAEPEATEPEVAEPQVAESQAPADEPAESKEPPAGTAVEADVRVIPIEADAALRFLQAGEQIRDIPVTPGEAVIFRVDNTAGFAHNFYIGEDSELMGASATTDTGIPDWESGVQNLEWIVPDDITDLKFGCTVPGHYTLMQGTFSLSE